MTEAFIAAANASAAAIVAAGGVAPVTRKQFTLMFVIERDRVLLGRKKRGFGAGKINGFGGKVESGETPLQGAVREMQEEAGVTPLKPVQRGMLFFEFVGSPLIFEVHVFVSDAYEGTVTETEEMAPQWFAKTDMPYAQMWADDAHWFPHVFAGKFYRAFGLFHTNDAMIDFHLELFDDTKVWMPGLWDSHVLKRPRGKAWADAHPDAKTPAPAAAAAPTADAGAAPAASAAPATTAAVCPVTGKSAAVPADAAAAAAVCPVTGKSVASASDAAATAAKGAGDGKDPLLGVPIPRAPAAAEYVVVPIEDLKALAPGKAGRDAWADAVRTTFSELGLSLNAKSTPELHARLQRFCDSAEPMIDVVAWSPAASKVTDRPLFSITAPTKATAPHLFAA